MDTSDPDSAAVWARLPVEERVRRVCGLRHVLASDPQPFVEAITVPFRRSVAESLAAELIPLADACRFLEREAARLLLPRKLSTRSRPIWLWGSAVLTYREPWGRVLIVGPGNYPLMIPGIQAVQALVAGNAVLLKPAPGCDEVARLLATTLHELGVPAGVFEVLDKSPEAVRAAVGRMHKVVLTGSEETGKSVLSLLAPNLIPAVMELSGCDAAFVLDRSNLDRTVDCLVFGLTLNSSASCIAPRRIFAIGEVADELVDRLAEALGKGPAAFVSPDAAAKLNTLGLQALAAGARLRTGALPVTQQAVPLLFDHCVPDMQLLREDVFAPFAGLVRVGSVEEAIAASRCCPYRLGATVFGPEDRARALAERIDAGCVVINDMIVPTADPRVSFGGRARSGYGMTRGAEGLLEMTRIKNVLVRRTGGRAHLRGHSGQTEEVLRTYLRLSHARSLRERLWAGRRLIRIAFPGALNRVQSPRARAECGSHE